MILILVNIFDMNKKELYEKNMKNNNNNNQGWALRLFSRFGSGSVRFGQFGSSIFPTEVNHSQFGSVCVRFGLYSVRFVFGSVYFLDRFTFQLYKYIVTNFQNLILKISPEVIRIDITKKIWIREKNVGDIEERDARQEFLFSIKFALGFRFRFTYNREIHTFLCFLNQIF